MRRVSLTVAAVALIALLAGIPGATAQAPSGRTLSLFESDRGSTFKFIDTPPRSRSQNPESRRFRFSVGDSIQFSNPVFDRQGGTRLGTVFGRLTVVRGTTFRNITFFVDATVLLGSDDQIVAGGLFRPARQTAAIPIVGGAGAYEGARGSLTSVDVRGGSQDTLHLLP